MKILGIESSHDDTSIALIEDQQVLFFHKISQIDIHKKYGGTIPEIASREHFQNYYILFNNETKLFNLAKLGQAIVWTICNHEDRIVQNTNDSEQYYINDKLERI